MTAIRRATRFSKALRTNYNSVSPEESIELVRGLIAQQPTTKGARNHGIVIEHGSDVYNVPDQTVACRAQAASRATANMNARRVYIDGKERDAAEQDVLEVPADAAEQDVLEVPADAAGEGDGVLERPPGAVQLVQENHFYLMVTINDQLADAYKFGHNDLLLMDAAYGLNGSRLSACVTLKVRDSLYYYRTVAQVQKLMFHCHRCFFEFLTCSYVVVICMHAGVYYPRV